MWEFRKGMVKAVKTQYVYCVLITKYCAMCMADLVQNKVQNS